MLTKLILNNFLSFKYETVIDVKATNYKVLQETNVYQDSLKGLLFVGANASGKTNIIRALRLLLEMLFAEKNIDLSLYKCLFSQNPSMSLEYEFTIKGHKVTYIIEYEVVKEVLVEQLSLNDQIVLNRVGSSGTTEITENKIYADINKDSLLLREIYFNTKFRNHDVLKEWYQFLLNSVFLDGYKEIIFSPGKIKLDLEGYFQEKGTGGINDFFESFNFNQRVEYTKKSKGNLVSFESPEKSLFFKREGIGEPIPFLLESLGNQKLVKLLPSFFHVVINGGMLIIDEFSSGLHNFLEELLVKYFHTKAKNAQIFLVSHSTNLLTTSLLRPDQAYSVSFNDGAGSAIKRFSSEQPRVAQNLEKMYTSGVFGGVPNYNTSELEHK